MKRFVPTLLMLVVLATAGAAAQGGPGDAGIYTTTLQNGLRVVVVEDRAAPVVQTSVWYGFGSLDETPGKTGLAHALEHMMFRGTPEISAGGLDDIVARRVSSRGCWNEIHIDHGADDGDRQPPGL